MNKRWLPAAPTVFKTLWGIGIFLIFPIWSFVEKEYDNQIRHLHRVHWCKADEKVERAASVFNDLYQQGYRYADGSRGNDVNHMIDLLLSANDCWSEEGHAANMLGSLYCDNILLPRDYNLAAKFFSEAFSKGQINSIRYFVDGSDICELDENHLR